MSKIQIVQKSFFIQSLVLVLFCSLAACDGVKDEKDAGIVLSDGGNSVVTDSGQAVTDSGQADTDSGQADTDSGQAVTDSGQAVTDSGQAVTDSGQAVTDSGIGVTGDRQLGTLCNQDAECGAGNVCGNLYSTGEKVCYRQCAALDMACDTEINAASIQGTCLLTAARKSICVVTSPENGDCGDGVNSTCSDDTTCITFSDASSGYGFVGRCLKFCSVENPSTCLSATGEDYCGCSAGSMCSGDININGLDDEGICVSESQVGDVCGSDETIFRWCSHPQECRIYVGETLGTCVLSD